MKSIVSRVMEQAHQGEEVTKSSGNSMFLGAEPSMGTPVPKSWFTDPYSMLSSVGLGYRPQPSSLTYETLRGMAERNTVIAAIHQTRLNQMAPFCKRPRTKYHVGLRVMHKRAAFDSNYKLTHAQRERCTEIEEFLFRTGMDKNPDRDGLETFVKKVVRDRLTLDQACAEKIPKRNGRPHSFYAADAATIRLATPRNRTGAPLTPEELAHTTRYVQVLEGRVVNEYTRKQMMFRVANPRTDLKVMGYGLSELELLILTVTAHLWAEEWNRKVFSQGSTIKGLLNIEGNLSGQQLEAFKRQWMMQVSGVSNSWRTPIVNATGIQWIPLQPSNSEMGYSAWMEYLIKIACAIYLIDPAEINFDTRAGIGSQPMFMTTNEAQQKISKDRGLQPLLSYVETMLNEEVVSEIDDDYEVRLVGLDAKSESEAIEQRMKRLQSYGTLNEIRREDDLPPLENGDIPMNPQYIGYLNQKAMQQQQPGMGGGMGGPPGGGGGMPPPGGGDPSQGGEDDGGLEEFANLFDKQKGKKGPGEEESKIGDHIRKETKPAKFEMGDEEAEYEENDDTREEWENSIQASESRRLQRLGGDLMKALDAFKDL